MKAHGSLLMLLWVSQPSIMLTVGEVLIRRFSSIWYNCVIRGDINRVE